MGNIIEVPELGQSLDDLVKTLMSGKADQIVEDVVRGANLRALSVGQESIRPFGGRLRDMGRRGGEMRRQGLSVGGIGGGASAMSGDAVLGLLNRIAGQPCMLWGADPPGGTLEACRRTKKLCGAIAPYFHSVPAAATNEPYTLKAKRWMWPLFWVDSSDANITVADLEYTGDPVFENGDGSGALDVTSLFPSNGYYGFVPGLPAVDTTNGLDFELANADGAAAQPFQGMFIVVSVRN